MRARTLVFVLVALTAYFCALGAALPADTEPAIKLGAWYQVPLADGSMAWTRLDAGEPGRLAWLVVKPGPWVPRTHTVVIAGPSPDPGPNPNPGPNPPPPPPVPTPGPLHVLMVYEFNDLGKVPQSQANILVSKPIRDYLKAKCAKDGDQPAFRFLDLKGPDGKDADFTRMPADWQAVIARAKGKPTPWAIITNGKDTYEGQWAPDADKQLELLKKYGGN